MLQITAHVNFHSPFIHRIYKSQSDLSFAQNSPSSLFTLLVNVLTGQLEPFVRCVLKLASPGTPTTPPTPSQHCSSTESSGHYYQCNEIATTQPTTQKRRCQLVSE